MASSTRIVVDRSRLAVAHGQEAERFAAAHPRSRSLFDRARGSLLGGVPMNWMAKWAGPHPVFVAQAKGAHFRCVDGHDYVDFCLGDTGRWQATRPPARSRPSRPPWAGGSRPCSRTRRRSSSGRSSGAASACTTGSSP